MQVDVSISPATVNLGQPVTISYSSSGCADVTLTIDNLPNPIDLGGDEINGTVKVLPVVSGILNVQIKGSGKLNDSNDYMPEITKNVSCQVN
jgi:hypothetical protein